MTEMPDEYLACFREVTRERYERRLIGLLRERFADARSVPDAALRPIVREQIARAATYALLSERDVATYVTTAWMMGRNFDRCFPAAVRVLRNLSLRPHDKCIWLESWTVRMFVTLEQRV